MKICPTCGQQVQSQSRFCIRCGTLLGDGSSSGNVQHTEDMNMPVLYAMVALLLVALLFPPWEAVSGQAPEFLGFHFVLWPPETAAGETGSISRVLLSIELVTIAVGGFYFSWLFRKRANS